MNYFFTFLLLVILPFQSFWAQCTFSSSTGTNYSVTIGLTPFEIVEIDRPFGCNTGINYYIRMEYNIAVSGNIPSGSLNNLSGNLIIDGDVLRFKLPESAGIGIVNAELVNPCNSRSYLPNPPVTATVNIQGPGIPNTTSSSCPLVGSPLPVELISYNVYEQSSNVSIEWSTATERNNDYFLVERSVDGVNFEFVQKVNGAGNSNSVMNYHTIDTHPMEGQAYYRLSQVDFDGSMTIHDMRAVSVKFVDEITLFPNPVVDNVLYIKGNYSKSNLQIYAADGRMVPHDFEGNSNSIDVSLLNNGVYFFNFTDSDSNLSQTIRVVVAK